MGVHFGLVFVLQVIALVCLFIAAMGWFTAPAPRPIWGWLGMFFWLLSWMIGGATLHNAIPQ
jgi:hypothetical protein